MIQLYNDNGAGLWVRTPQYYELDGIGTVDTQLWAERGQWDELSASGIYEEWISPEIAPLGYEAPVLEEIDGRVRLARHPNGSMSDRADEQREWYKREIQDSFDAAISGVTDVAYADDPALQVILDEANIALRQKVDELAETADADLATFDPSLSSPPVDPLVSAASMAMQEDDLLAFGDVTPEQEASLTTHRAYLQAYMDAGDDTEPVPEIPSNCRIIVGATGEDLARLVLRREEIDGWWYPTFTLYTDREINVSSHWMAIYDESAVDDKSDTTTGYLSTIPFVESGPGVYKVEGSASGLARGKDFVFKSTLCDGHLSNPWWDKLTLAANETEARFHVRWAGVGQ